MQNFSKNSKKFEFWGQFFSQNYGHFVESLQKVCKILRTILQNLNFAKSYKLNVEIVSVPEGKKSIEEVEKILKKTKEKFSKNRIKTTTKIIDGSAVNSIVNHAKDDSIVILGVSPKNPIMKYFFGSKPLSIAQKCNCPVLITK